jgi:hypothetical protein
MQHLGVHSKCMLSCISSMLPSEREGGRQEERERRGRGREGESE